MVKHTLQSVKLGTIKNPNGIDSDLLRSNPAMLAVSYGHRPITIRKHRVQIGIDCFRLLPAWVSGRKAVGNIVHHIADRISQQRFTLLERCHKFVFRHTTVYLLSISLRRIAASFLISSSDMALAPRTQSSKAFFSKKISLPAGLKYGNWLRCVIL